MITEFPAAEFIWQETDKQTSSRQSPTFPCFNFSIKYIQLFLNKSYPIAVRLQSSMSCRFKIHKIL